MDQKRLNRRDFLRLSALTATGAVLAGCAKPTPEVVQQTVEVPVVQTVVVQATDTPLPEPTTVPVGANLECTVVWMFDDLDILQDQMEDFYAENPGITIESMDSDETRFKAMMAAGTPPDVYATSGRQTAYYVGRGIPLAIDPYIEVSTKVTWDDLAPVHSCMRWDGSSIGSGPSYGLVKDWSCNQGHWVNGKVYEEVGVPMPGPTDFLTYADVAAAAAQFATREGDRTLRFGYSGGTAHTTEKMMQMACIENDVKLYDEFYSRINIVGNEPAYNMLKWLYDLQEQGISPSPVNPHGGWDAQDFAQGRIGVIQDGYWFGALLKMWAADDPAVQELVDDGTVAVMVAGVYWGKKKLNPSFGATADAIHSKTMCPDGAWKVLEYYTSGTPAINRASTGWGVPPLLSLYPLMPKETPFDQMVQASQQEQEKYANVALQQNPYYDADSLGGVVWVQNLEQALNGSITFDELVQNVEDEVNQMIADGINAIG